MARYTSAIKHNKLSLLTLLGNLKYCFHTVRDLNISISYCHQDHFAIGKRAYGKILQNVLKIKKMISNNIHDIEIVYAGGTISSLVSSGGYREGGHKIDLLALLSMHSPNAALDINVLNTSFAYLGLSENIDFAYWKNIEEQVGEALAHKPEAVVITHGTDSLEQTARYLSQKFDDLLKSTKTSIIITAANRDTSHPDTDAWSNLEFALASAKQVMEPDVYVAFHDQLIPANEVVKEPFDGKEMNYISRFSQRYGLLERMQREQNERIISKIKVFFGRELNNYSAIINYPVNKVVHDHSEFLSSLESLPEVKAVVLTLYHSGTANTENEESSVVKLVKTLRNKGIVVFGVTENGEPVDLHLYETSVKLREAGVVPLYDMNRDVAIEKLNYLIGLAPDVLIDQMLSNYVGEIEAAVHEEDKTALRDLYRE